VGEKARLMLSSVECFGVFLGFFVLWVLGFRACRVILWVVLLSFGFLACLEPPVYTAYVLKGAKHFLIIYIAYKK
jgi:hypothetical protein